MFIVGLPAERFNWNEVYQSWLFSNVKFSAIWFFSSRYPDEEAGQIPMAFVVRKPGSNITEAEIMDFIAKQACSLVSIYKVKKFIVVTCN